ncbi:FABP family protein [Nocardioides sp. HDW12B]|uniref:FABP family protein n=1 Tax=Nocardioides sp. HDW12B TaxID=2714939 RepID=UPI00140A6E75|nr:FABP family protein [Nocardioides sp. HDW12B]QIK64942.1 FABP family protein [Nocardioides sp. HDW12B]
MPFEIPPNLHPNLHKFAWLLGRWEGGGDGDYPTIDAFKFHQEAIFQQDGRPFIHYMAKATVVDDAGNKIRDAAQETGFLRCQEDGSVELLLTHNTGFLELWHGKVDGAKLDLTTDAVIRTETAKEVTAGHRLYGLVESELWFAYDMAAAGQPLTPHLWGKLSRA